MRREWSGRRRFGEPAGRVLRRTVCPHRHHRRRFGAGAVELPVHCHDGPGEPAADGRARHAGARRRVDGGGPAHGRSFRPSRTGPSRADQAPVLRPIPSSAPLPPVVETRSRPPPPQSGRALGRGTSAAGTATEVLGARTLVIVARTRRTSAGIDLLHQVASASRSPRTQLPAPQAAASLARMNDAGPRQGPASAEAVDDRPSLTWWQMSIEAVAVGAENVSCSSALAVPRRLGSTRPARRTRIVCLPNTATDGDPLRLHRGRRPAPPARARAQGQEQRQARDRVELSVCCSQFAEIESTTYLREALRSERSSGGRQSAALAGHEARVVWAAVTMVFLRTSAGVVAGGWATFVADGTERYRQNGQPPARRHEAAVLTSSQPSSIRRARTARPRTRHSGCAANSLHVEDTDGVVRRRSAVR